MRVRYFLLAWASTILASTVAPSLEARGDEPFAMLADFNDVDIRETTFLDVSGRTLPVCQLLDVRPRDEYLAGHLAGAIWVDVKQAQAIAGRPGGLTDRDAWLDWITPLNLSIQSQVRIIDGAQQLDAARIWWLLRYLGVAKVGLVNGNFALWKAQRRAVTDKVPATQGITFPVDFQTDRLATRADVLASLQAADTRIIDARSVEEWVGKTMRAKRGGHIPNACRVEWTELVTQEGRFLPRAKLQAKLETAGIRPGEPVITHCQSGGRASVDAFVFELLGHPTRNYYLSWADWGNADDTPITTEEAPAGQQASLEVARPTEAVGIAQPASTPAPAPPAPATKPFTAEYYYKCHWGRSDEFLALFEKNHLPILRERIKQGNILKVSMTKPRIHENEFGRWDYRVTIEFRDAASAFDPATDEAIKVRLFPDQNQYRLEEQRRFELLDAHWDLPIDEVDLDKPVSVP